MEQAISKSDLMMKVSVGIGMHMEKANRMAEEAGISHWKCINPYHMWQRTDGEKCRVFFGLADKEWHLFLREFDNANPLKV
jgi:hypothetical protein